MSVPIRDVNDMFVVQTAVIGEADVICTKDVRSLERLGISVMDDVTLIQRMRS